MLLYSCRSRGYSRGIISRVYQWPSETHAFIDRCFLFHKNIPSVNLRGVTATSCFALLALLAKSSSPILYVHDRQVKITSCTIQGNFSFIAYLCIEKKANFFIQYSSRKRKREREGALYFLSLMNITLLYQNMYERV